jgi:hypothetical protein
MAKLSVAKARTEQPKGRERERIQLIETPPQQEWFVKAKTARGRSVLYLCLQVTGLHARLYGPFPSERQALLFLDSVLDSIGDALCEADDQCGKRMLNGPYQKVRPPVVAYLVLKHVPDVL